jgi:fatty-acyl-CoA synthase
VTPEAFAGTIAAFAVGARVAGIRPGLTDNQLAHLRSGDDAMWISDAGVAELLATADDGVPLTAAGRPADIARIIYTSGSTGNPKGCAQTYAAMTAAWTAHPDRWPPAIRELAGRLRRHLVFGSLSSQVMLEYGVLALAAGGTLVAAHPPDFPGSFVRHRATASVITVGKLYQLVRDQRANPVDLGGLRALMVSGSPLSPGRLREAIDVLGPVIFHGYGQTETGMIAMVTPAEMAASDTALASVGRPPAAVDVQIRPAATGASPSGRHPEPERLPGLVTTGASSSEPHPQPERPPGSAATGAGSSGRHGAAGLVPVGGSGELFVRTPSQAIGYWGEPAETADVFADGWVRTRDLARLDEDGYLHLLGRVRDVIIVNANLIYAGPIERALAEHPDVAEAYVVGRPDDRTGEAIHAYLVPRANRLPDVEALRRLVAVRLGDAAVPQTVTVIDRVPVAPSGKPDKRALLP